MNPLQPTRTVLKRIRRKLKLRVKIRLANPWIKTTVYCFLIKAVVHCYQHQYTIWDLGPLLMIFKVCRMTYAHLESILPHMITTAWNILSWRSYFVSRPLILPHNGGTLKHFGYIIHPRLVREGEKDAWDKQCKQQGTTLRNVNSHTGEYDSPRGSISTQPEWCSEVYWHGVGVHIKHILSPLPPHHTSWVRQILSNGSSQLHFVQPTLNLSDGLV